MGIFKMNKKAAVATTATWIVAMFILLFLCVIFILGVLTISAKQKVGDVFNEISIEQKSITTDLVIQRSLESVLSEQIILENKKISLSEAIATSDEDKIAAVFKESFEKTFKEILPPRSENDYTFWWIRVYEKGEAIEEYAPDKKLQAGSQLCNPNEDDLVIYYFIGEKRLVTCVQKEYYKAWREEKNE